MKNRNCTAFSIALLTLAVAASQTRAQSTYTPYTITTLAGSAGQLGTNDGTGSAARFNYPEGVAVDNAGNLYVADTDNYTIRKITPAGTVTTLAGSAGLNGSADGTGSAARFFSPFGLVVDSAGNVYVADSFNYTIRKITPAGTVTTLAGSAGQFGSADGTGSAARFYNPAGLAVDNAGNLYVADRINHTIRKVTPAGLVTTFAGLAGNVGTADGTGSAARFYYPHGVAVDGAGNVLVADTSNDTIRKITPAGTVTTLAGTAGQYGSADGTGSAARFSTPIGVAVDSAGNVYVADSGNHTIRRVTPAGTVTTLAGSAGQTGSTNGTGGTARFSSPFGVAVDNAGNLYVGDNANHTIRKGTPVTATLTISRQISNIVHHFTPPNLTTLGYVTDEIIFDRAGVTNINLSQYSNFELRPFASGGQRIVVNAPTNFTSSVSLYYLAASDAASNPTTNNTLNFEDFSGVLPARTYSFFAIANAGNAVVFQADHSYANAVGFTALKYAFTPTYNPTNSPKTFQLPTGGATNFLTFSYETSQTNDPGPFVTLAASNPLSDVTYDPSLGTLPENQGFTRVDNAIALDPIVSGGVLNQNTFSNSAAQQWWYAISSDAFDFSAGFTLEANLYVIQSSQSAYMGNRYAGYEFGAVDNTGRYLGVNIIGAGVWLDTSGIGSAPPGGGTTNNPFDPHTGFDTYRLVVLGTNATLFINGSPLLSTSLGSSVNPTNTNMVFFGDKTTLAINRTQLAWFRARPAAPLAILVGPQNQTVVSGTSVTFSVVATGNEPLRYQWTFNGTNLVGQTNTSLFLPNVQLTNAGTYCVVVSDTSNVTNTYCATLTVLAPPGITVQPLSQTVSSGTNVTFSVGATGSGPLLYQWRYNGANILGATNSTYTILNVQPSDGGVFSVLVQNSAGVVVSLDATLKVLSPALAFGDNLAARGTLSGLSGVGSGNNTNATREVGEPNHAGKFGSHSVWLEWTAPGSGVATFNTRGSSCDTLLALYTGTSFSNLVARASDDDSGGFFTSKAVVNVTNGIQYIIAIDGLGSASGDLVLSWNLVTNTPAIPVITQHPLDVTVTNGGSATFAITTASPNVTYQWYFNQSLVLTGATSATLVIPNVVRSNVGFYTVEVTGTNSQTVRSLAGSLEIGTEVATHTFDKLVDLFQAFQTNGGGNFAGSWKKGGGATPASLSFPSVAAGSLGSQIINNFGATTDQGEPILTNVIGGNSRWYLLTAATNGTMVVDTAGSEINTQLKVYTGSNILSMALVAGDNHGSNSLVSFAAGAGTNYLIGVDGVTNNVGVVNINWRLGTPPAGGGYVGSQALKLGDTLLLQAGDPGALPDPTYQWRLNDANLQGATSASYTRTNLQYNHGGVYSVVVSNFVGVVTNVIATVSVQSPLLLVLDGSSGVPKSRLSATATQARVLQLSTNLTQWTPLYTNADPSVPVVYLDPNSAARTKGFYRLLPWP